MTELQRKIYDGRRRAQRDYHDVKHLVAFVRPAEWQKFLVESAGQVADLDPPDRLPEWGDAATVMAFGIPIFGRAHTDHIVDVRCMWRGVSNYNVGLPAPGHQTSDLEAYHASGYLPHSLRGARQPSRDAGGLSFETYEIPVNRDLLAPAGTVTYRCTWRAW